MKQPEQSKSVAQNPFRGSSLGGGKSDPNQYLTTNRIKYQEWKNVEKAQLDDKKAHELKTHHFSLGTSKFIIRQLQQQAIADHHEPVLPRLKGNFWGGRKDLGRTKTSYESTQPWF